MDYRPKFGFTLELMTKFVAMPVGLDKVFACVRPVVFAQRGSPWFAATGTGFLIKFGIHYFFVTARHCLHEFSYSDILVPYSSGHQSPIPLRGLQLFDSRNPEDTDHADVAVFMLEPSRLQRDLFDGEVPFDLSLNTLVLDGEFERNMPLAFKGLSPARSHYDYEDHSKSIYHFSAAIGSYDGPDETIDLVHKFRMQKTVNPPDLDGFSGGPVFYVPNPDRAETGAAFAGMLVRASGAEGILRFVSGFHIYAHLHATLKWNGISEGIPL